MGLAPFLAPRSLPAARSAGLAPLQLGQAEPTPRVAGAEPAPSASARAAPESDERRARSESEWVARLRVQVARDESEAANPGSRRGQRGDLMLASGTGRFVSSVEIRQLQERLESRLATGPAIGSVRRIDERA